MLANTETPQIKWSRWLEAQQYEQAFWRKRAAGIAQRTEGQLDWYDWNARRLEERLATLPSPVARDGKVLEIGSGPLGIVNALKWGERYAIDPLESFYKEQPTLVSLRRPGATYLTGTGERLPFGDASFSLVIIENVIDHTYAPGKILQEISRILEPSGYLYLLVNVHTPWGANLHDLLAALRIDKGHPYTFTSQSLRRFLTQHQFAILYQDIEDYEAVKRANRRSSGVTDKIKGYTGLSEFQHAVIGRKDVSRETVKR